MCTSARKIKDQLKQEKFYLPILILAPGNEAFLWKAIKPRLDDKLLKAGSNDANSSNTATIEDVEMISVKHELQDDWGGQSTTQSRVVWLKVLPILEGPYLLRNGYYDGVMDILGIGKNLS